MFNVGDEVLCINDSEPSQNPPNVVVKGRVYTVVGHGLVTRRTVMGGFLLINFHPTVHVAEVPSQRGFFVFRFVKVDKKARATDITLFKEIADGTRTVPLEDMPPIRVPEKVAQLLRKYM